MKSCMVHNFITIKMQTMTVQKDKALSLQMTKEIV